MTPSAERRGTPAGAAGLDAGWRRAQQRTQQAALPAGAAVVSCSAAIGDGGLGRHLAEILDAFDRAGNPATCICDAARARATPARSGLRGAGRLALPHPARLLRASRAPTSPGVRTRAFMSEFDAHAARRLPSAEHLIAFNCQALSQLRAARAARYESVALVSANSHMRHVVSRHAAALRRYPLEGSWTSRLLARSLAEYERADRIYVASRYIRDSFLEEGFSEDRLVDFPLTPDPRFRPGVAEERPERFEVVYVGSLHVHKGVPLLIDAIARLPGRDLRLRLVGGWATPGMRRFVERARERDRRIVLSPGDPLPHLRRAGVCVHPAYEDGFAYAPAEALAAGVPVIVSEDTGMKDLVDRGRTGLIVPTGDLDALTEAIEAAHDGALGLAGAAR
jgi:glycosyltransferase involved in cell wall biosynthesis